MVVDTSALLAILFGEPEKDRFIEAVASAPEVLVSAGTLLEASLVVEARRGEAAGRELDLFLHRAGVRAVAVDADQVEVARAAWRRFGKGRHPAGLKFGDLYAYALARVQDDVLLFKGDDFSRTDIRPA
ncbi:type II toxin-antitoxin system VapC family toxin [Jannaschia sp. R86511]|uniref:type II toxin-antitoxin system VapC family toxin n=1 Tax=Jannaschia sp. R86511 TaxID=3093853 RepID=UPI0036D426AC